ncbi:serine kinase [Spirosoma fluminis]
MELSLYYYKAYGLVIGSEIPLPPLPEISPAPADLRIKRSQLPANSALEPSKAYRAGLNARCAQDQSGQIWLTWPPLLSYLATDGTKLLVDTTQTDADLVALFTYSEALGLILFQRGYFLLHGSAVQINDKGIVFLGEPGAGKSTTVAAFAQQGFGVISDDMVCIRVNESGTPVLIPAFPQIKIWETSVDGLQLAKEELAPVREGVNKFSWNDSITFEQDEVPLEQIYVLTAPTDSGGSTELLLQSQVPVELLGYFPLPDSLLRGASLKDFFEKSSSIARSVPVIRMSRPANFARLYDFVEYLTTTA